MAEIDLEQIHEDLAEIGDQLADIGDLLAVLAMLHAEHAGAKLRLTEVLERKRW